MSELNYRTKLGHLHVQGWRKQVMEASAELGIEVATAGTRVSRALDLAGERVWVKGGPLSGRARARHGLRKILLRRRAPRIQEYFNLSWLIERHFQVALPHAAGVFTRAGFPLYQYLVTAEIAGARTLLEVLEDGRGADRGALLAELARELARLHALGFVHHDLFLRNMLVAPIEGGRALHFLDAWRGGPPPQLRGAAYDLACLFLDGAAVLARDEQVRFFADYRAQRAAQGRPVDLARLSPAVARIRLRLRAKLVGEPGRARGRSLPPADWEVPEIAC